MSNGLFDVLERKGLLGGFNRNVVALEPILLEMSRLGMPVDPEAFAEVDAFLRVTKTKFLAELQALIPDECRKKKTYKKNPKKVTAAHFAVDGVWYKWEPWKPSNQALIRYMKFRKHPVPKDKDKETTKAIEVIRLSRSTKDPVYGKVIEYRKVSTILSNHMKNWRPGPDGRVHSTFYCDPATGQLSSRRPNVQNAPKHDDPEFGGYAKIFRKMIQAKPGHTLVEFDYKSFHAQTLAFCAEDKDYLRLAKLDIHSYLAAHLVREPRASVALTWDDKSLGEYLAWIKENHGFVRDYKAKRAILGYGFGMGYKKLYDMNRESFDGPIDAKRTLQVLDATFPVTKAWRDTIKKQAHEQGFLISRYGFIRYFWEVFRWKDGGFTAGGDDAEAAIAFLPANSAFGHMRERMIEVAHAGWAQSYNLINNIHDSLLFECPDELLGQVMVVKDIMERPSNVLINSICPNGLSVEVDVQMGRNWSKYNKKNPAENSGGMRGV